MPAPLAKRAASNTKLRKLSGATYHVSATKLQRITPTKPARKHDNNKNYPSSQGVRPKKNVLAEKSAKGEGV